MIQVFFIFFRLGCISFGGPLAHLGYFHEEFVRRRHWIDDADYADLVTLCQFLPGPASSQVGMALGLSRAGVPGAIAAWLGFTLPSALILVLFAISLSSLDFLNATYVHGFKIAAVAVVAQALWGMGRSLCPDRQRFTIAVLAAILSLGITSVLGQMFAIIVGGLWGLIALKQITALPHVPLPRKLSKASGSLFLFCFMLMLFLLPWFAQLLPSVKSLHLFDSFFRVGSLVFGGGHVVLPLLQHEVVSNGWVSNEAFMAGYGAAQAIPGPLFSFAAFLGAMSGVSTSIWWGASLGLIAIFLPSLLLIVGILPYWEKLRTFQKLRSAVLGINAAVVGLLLAAFYDPVWKSAIDNAGDFSVALLSFLLLSFWKVPSWLVVLLSAVLTAILN